MLATKVIIATLAVLQVVYCGDSKADQCKGPPGGEPNYLDCCDIPLVFSEEEVAVCGIIKPEDGKPRPHIDARDCTTSLCVLGKHDLIKDGDKVNRDVARTYLDSYALENPEFANAVNLTKEECLGPNGPAGPKRYCEPNRFITCVSHTIFENCPNWVDSETCKKVKESVDECKLHKSK